jgi:hypothetical protein
MTNKNDALKQALNAENEQTLTPAQIKNKQLLKSNTEAHTVKRDTKTAKINVLTYPWIKDGLDEVATANMISRNHLINIILADYVKGNFQPTDEVAPINRPLYKNHE